MATKETLKEHILYQECQHNPLISNGSVVCQECGFILDRDYRNTNFVLGTNVNDGMRNISKQYVSIGDDLSHIGRLGSQIGRNKKFNIKDSANKSLAPDLQKKFKRLRTRAQYISIKGNETIYRIFSILNSVSSSLNLPEHIRKTAAYYYRKLIKKERINNISCICFCLWNAIRIFKAPVTLKEVIDIFRKIGHRISTHLIIRDGCLYIQYLYEEGIKKTTPKLPIDYLPRLFGMLRQKSNIIEERISYKNIYFYKDITLYYSELETLAMKISNQLEFQLALFSPHPFNYASSLIYFADKLLSLKNNHRPVLTQRIVSKLSKVAIYSIRDLYISMFKQYYLKEKNRREKKWDAN